jgi:hypothetical protein
MTIDLVEVFTALLDVTDDLDASEMSSITGLPLERCNEIITLRNELSENRSTWEDPDF